MPLMPSFKKSVLTINLILKNIQSSKIFRNAFCFIKFHQMSTLNLQNNAKWEALNWSEWVYWNYRYASQIGPKIYKPYETTPIIEV